jgi:hypothetical protein
MLNCPSLPSGTHRVHTIRKPQVIPTANTAEPGDNPFARGYRPYTQSAPICSATWSSSSGYRCPYWSSVMTAVAWPSSRCTVLIDARDRIAKGNTPGVRRGWRAVPWAGSTSSPPAANVFGSAPLATAWHTCFPDNRSPPHRSMVMPPSCGVPVIWACRPAMMSPRRPASDTSERVGRGRLALSVSWLLGC